MILAPSQRRVISWWVFVQNKNGPLLKGEMSWLYEFLLVLTRQWLVF